MALKELRTRWGELSKLVKGVVIVAVLGPIALVFAFNWMFGWFDAGVWRKFAALAGVYVMAGLLTLPAWLLRNKMPANERARGSTTIAIDYAVTLVGIVVAIVVVLRDAEFLGPPPDALPTLSRSVRVGAESDVARQVLVAHAKTIKWDETTHGQADYSILDSIGTKGTVVPVPRLHNAERKHLKDGRILWRVTIVNPPKYRGLGYPRLNLPEGVSYILVHNYKKATQTDKMGYQGDAEHRHAGDVDPPDTHIMGFADALIIPENDSLPVQAGPRRVVVKRHFSYWWNRPLARFRGPGDHHLWGDCGSHGCCEL